MNKTQRQRKIETQQRREEQAIAVALLGVPSFRAKANLPAAPRDTLETIARVMGVNKEAVRLIEASAMRKIRLALPPDLVADCFDLFNQYELTTTSPKKQNGNNN